MRIKLRKLPDSRSVNMNITLPVELKARIDRYAEFYSNTWTQQIDARNLIPHIISQFVASDRAFQKLEYARTLSAEDEPSELRGDRSSDGR